MLIHSVTPIEMLVEQPQIPQMQYRKIGCGYLEGTETPQGFCVSCLHSTDLSLYLQPGYAPGNICR